MDIPTDIKLELSDGHIVNAMYAHKRIKSYLKRCGLPECSTSYRCGEISAISYDEKELILIIKNKEDLIKLKK